VHPIPDLAISESRLPLPAAIGLAVYEFGIDGDSLVELAMTYNPPFGINFCTEILELSNEFCRHRNDFRILAAPAAHSPSKIGVNRAVSIYFF
jgi:hypothetical protein